MKFEVITIFPEFFDVARVGLLGTALQSGTLALDTLSPREFATDKHRSVDDTPYGGGNGMVMRVDVLVNAIESLDARRGGVRARKILLSPAGQPFTQSVAARLSSEQALTFVCGRYEGIDDRITSFVDEELSLGDFVLLGGEAAALAMIEAVARLVPGVLGNSASAAEESHVGGVLEYPQYTRPVEFRGQTVPEVLRSGDHGAVAEWRRAQSLIRTRERRPDVWSRLELSAKDLKILSKYER